MREEAKIIDFGQARRDKLNRGKRAQMGSTPEGQILYPEEKIEITEGEALTIAHDLIEKYPDEEALIKDFTEREGNRTRGDSLLSDQGHGRGVRERMQKSLANQREEIAAYTMEDLMRVFQIHKKNPANYSGVRLRAVADEIIKRFLVGIKSSGA